MNAREEWLKRRQAGIGGSDVAGILGISPWNTPLDIYLSKVEPQAEEDMSEPAYWGTVLEDVVAAEHATRTGHKVQRVNALIRHPAEPWMIANIDRAIVTPGSRARLDDAGRLLGADGLLECKTSNAFKASDWGRDGDDEAIPTHYAAQGMWYLAVTGLEWIDFSCLIGGQKFVTKRLVRDEDTIKAITERCRAFWFDHIQARKPPEPVNAADVTTLFPSDNGQAVEATEDLLIAFNESKVLREQIEQAEAQLEQRILAMKLAIGEASALATQGKTLVTWKKAKGASKTDWKAAADQIKGWMIEQSIEGGVDAVRAIIDDNTSETEGSRRFLFAKK